MTPERRHRFRNDGMGTPGPWESISIFGNEYQTGNSIWGEWRRTRSACPWAGGGLDLALGEALSELC